ncbi:MAG: efflux RND transporter periplasmic adaptor subunit [Firmicutes bacterium]|nr:efflux RND transporter periplasmic adaptor subunit [Bacillota bacterium]MCL5039487.1 efflux RND transporter periplasmic adaptor subunit [Bacillota bacterium]
MSDLPTSNINPKRSFRRILWFLAGVLLLVLAGLLFFQIRRPAPSPYTQVTVKRGKITSAVTATGVVEPLNRAEVRTQVAGTVQNFSLSEGDPVKARQEVAFIDTLAQTSRILQIRQNLLVARDNLNQLKLKAAAEPIQNRDQLRLAELKVERAKATLARLQSLPNNDDLTSARRDLEDARLSLELTRSGFDLSRVSGEDIEAQKARVAQYEQELTDAQRYPYNYARLRQAEANLALARQTLSDLELKAQVQPGQFDLQLKQAQLKVDRAQAKLDSLNSGATEDQLTAAKRDLEEAGLNLEIARYNTSLNKTSPEDIQVAELRVQQLEKDLEMALSDSRIITPIEGTIVNKYVKDGDFVTPGTPVVAVANMSSLLLRATVDEVDVGRLKVGQKATVTFDSLPGRTYQGMVTKISLAGRRQGDIALFEVMVELKNWEGVRLAMTGNISIIYGEKDNVLYLPNEVIYVRAGKKVVNVLDDKGEITYKKIETGLKNENFTEVVSGLEEGEKVLMLLNNARPSPSLGNLIRFGR